MEEILLEKFDAEIFPEGEENRHVMVIPEWCKDYFIFTVCRNPYERARSQWLEVRHKEWYAKYKKKNTFVEFVKNFLIPEGNRKKREWISCTMTSLVKELNPNVIKIENIDVEFNKLPFVRKFIKMPHKNVSISKDKPVLTRNAIYWINRWAKEDFKYFKYPMKHVVKHQ